MSEPETILAHAARLLRRGSPLAGRTVVVTAGPTREPIDPVRVVTNRSSGKMGYRLAEAAWERGADVRARQRAGRPSAAPVGVRLRSVETTEDLEKAVAEELPRADVLIMAAAPADYRPVQPERRQAPAHRRRPGHSDGTDGRHPAGHASRSGSRAASSSASRSRPGTPSHKARTKLERKALDLIVVNDALEPGAGLRRGHQSRRDPRPRGQRPGGAARLEAGSGRHHPRRRGGAPWLTTWQQYLAAAGGAGRRRGRTSPAAAWRRAAARRPAPMPPHRRVPRVRGHAVAATAPRRSPAPGSTIDLPVADLLGDGLGSLRHARRRRRADRGVHALRPVEGPEQHRAGRGQPDGRLMLVGEGPGATEDETGRPFVAQAGELLDADPRRYRDPAGECIHCQRREVPAAAEPEAVAGRDPPPACRTSAVRSQLVRPKVILALGGHRRRGAARRPEEPGRTARQGAPLRGHSARRDVPPRRTAPQPELEEADLG